MKPYCSIRYGTLPFYEGEDQPIAHKPSWRRRGEWRVFEDIDCIGIFGWAAGDREGFLQAERDAHADVLRQRKMTRDMDLLEGNYDLSGMTYVQFFRLQVRICHARMRLAFRFPNDPKAPALVKLWRDQRDHYRWAHRQANKWEFNPAVRMAMMTHPLRELLDEQEASYRRAGMGTDNKDRAEAVTRFMMDQVR